jgi:hypothetical protein
MHFLGLIKAKLPLIKLCFEMLFDSIPRSTAFIMSMISTMLQLNTGIPGHIKLCKFNKL